MSVTDIAVLIATAALLAGLGWFFFAPRRAATAQVAGGVQRIEVRVSGGYRPDVIRLRQGVPTELVFDRQEMGDCTSRVVFPELRVSAALPAFQRTTVHLTPAHAGSFGFACAMNMIHGTLIVEPDATHPTPSSALAEPAGPANSHLSGTENAGTKDGEAQERRAEIRDLTRRVAVGTVLTLPVLFAVMAADLFKA